MVRPPLLPKKEKLEIASHKCEEMNSWLGQSKRFQNTWSGHVLPFSLNVFKCFILWPAFWVLHTRSTGQNLLFPCFPQVFARFWYSLGKWTTRYMYSIECILKLNNIIIIVWGYNINYIDELALASSKWRVN